MKRRLVIFSGYNQRAIISFLRVIEPIGIPFSIIASSVVDPIFQTDYCKFVDITREKQDLTFCSFKELFKALQKKYKDSKFIVLPSTEALNRFLIDESTKFNKIGVEVPLASMDVYQTLSDKYRFGNYCASLGLSVPREFGRSPKPPFVAKPRKYLSESGKAYSPQLIMSESDLSIFKNDYIESDFYFQEYIDGESYYLLFYFPKGGEQELRFSQKNLVQQPQGKSIVCAVSDSMFRHPIADSYVNAFRQLGYSGFAMIELRKRGDEFYLIECNPRLWGPSQLFVDCGVPFFEMWLKDYSLLQSSINLDVDLVEKYYLWSGGIVPFGFDQMVYLSGYSKAQFQADFFNILESDVYLREDSLKIFMVESRISNEK